MTPRSQSPDGAGADDPGAALIATRYRLLKRIGEGGVGTVYEALHVALRRRVAIKMLHARYAGDATLVDRMRVEAQALAQVESAHIVEVLDFGQTADGRPFVVMPLLVGCTVADELRRRGALPASEAVALVAQLLAGLEVAHSAGLVHRDIKVENLFLCKSQPGPPVLKILDFGLTKVLPGAGDVPPGLQTQEGLVIGTPRFMAPEQARGAPVDRRADLYSAGVVLYQLVAGRDPFYHVSGVVPLLTAHAEEKVRPASEVALQPITPHLDAVILRALAKRPDHRYATAGAFCAALLSSVSLATPERPIHVETAQGVTVPLACLLVLGGAAVSALAVTLLGHAP
jgi:serine/threonine-protein kinase